MATKLKNKIVFGNEVLIDLTADTITKDKVLAGFTFHDNAGNTLTGECDYDVNSGDATVKVAEILNGKTAYARGAKLEGTMPNNAKFDITISNVNDSIAIPQGYHDGSGKASLNADELKKLIAGNIKQGITILGVTGTLQPSSSVKVTAKTVTPTKTSQVVLPGSGFDYLTQVTVNGIPYVETENSAGGITVTIG